MSWYLDTSAFLKLFVRESESEAMRSWFGSHGSLWSSQLLQTEALRCAARLGVDADSVEGVLADVSLVLPSTATSAAAAQLQPISLRTLDALHLATALELGGDLNAIVAYDGRVLDGALSLGIPTVHPGRN